MKPNRSDVQLSGEAAAQVEEATRNYFDRLAPKRPTKPQRSEHDSNHADASFSSGVDSIPELLQFQILEEDNQKLQLRKVDDDDDDDDDDDEFTETEYYRDLNCVDKNHHTTGTGFIKTDDTEGKCFSLTPDSSSVTEHHHSCGGNPATNDWIPAKGDMVNFISGKPNRSERD